MAGSVAGITYTICFTLLCIINQIMVSLDGRAQYTASNLTGVVIAIIILSAYKLKDFFKPIYAVWAAFMCAFIPIVLVIANDTYPYKGKLITSLINIVLYGLIVIRIAEKIIIEKNASTIRWSIFVCWICMIGLMIVSRYDGAWPIWFGAMFGSFYLTDYKNDTLEKLFLSLVNGVIIGFFIIQGSAFLFRPYDTFPRYHGMSLNENMNALFYLMTFCAFLCKWFILKKTGKKIIFRIITLLFSAAMYGFVVLTGCKAALFAMIAVNIVFLICFLRLCKKKILSFVGICAIIGVVAFVSVPVTYLAARYIPTIHLHPIYLAGEWSEDRLQPGEPGDSEKYISFNEMLEENVGRILWFVNFDKEENVGSILPVMQAYAENETVDATVTGKDLDFDESLIDSPLKFRFLIHSTYIKWLNLLGHESSEGGIAFGDWYYAPHAHNWLLQLAFWFGIPVGILLIGMCVLYVITFIHLLKNGKDIYACILGCFITAFIVFGMYEVDWSVGQLPFTLFFFLFYFAVNKRWETE